MNILKCWDPHHYVATMRVMNPSCLICYVIRWNQYLAMWLRGWVAKGVNSMVAYGYFLFCVWLCVLDMFNS